MPFIPNQASAAFPDQAQVDAVDLDIITGADGGTAVVSGCAVTSTGAGNGSVTVAAGVVRSTDLLVTVAGNTVAITANATGFTRYDLITVPTGGTAVATAGTAAASPVFPAVPAGSVALAAVRVPNGHTGTTTVPANTIVDKRVFVSDRADAGTVAGVTFENRFQHKDPSKVNLYVKGVNDPSAFLKPIFQVDDKNAAPIFWVAPVGGIYVTDDMQTAYTVFGPYYSRFDVYGYGWRGAQCSYAFAGPPGNMLSFTDAVHEIYQATRLPTVGSWGVVAACTLGTTDLGAPPTGSPTGYRSALVITNTTGASAWIATPGGTSAYSGVTPGDRIAPVFWMRSSSAAAARNATIRITWLTSAGATVGSDIDAVVSVPNTGAWTRVFNTGLVAPATAARVQVSILLASANGEVHHVAGVGLMRGDNDGIFAPPFFGQEISGTGKVGGAALAGDRWIRTDQPGVPGMREYVCRIGGAPNVQYWDPVDTSTVIRLRADQPVTAAVLADVTGISFPVSAGREYQVDLSLILTASPTANIVKPQPTTVVSASPPPIGQALSNRLSNLAGAQPYVARPPQTLGAPGGRVGVIRGAQPDAPTGWQVGFTGPAMTNFTSICEYQTSTGSWATDTIASPTIGLPVAHAPVSAAYAAGVRLLLRARLHIVPAASGTLQLQLASTAAPTAITAVRGSTLTVT